MKKEDVKVSAELQAGSLHKKLTYHVLSEVFLKIIQHNCNFELHM